MKKSLVFGLVLSFLSSVSLAQLTPGPGHGGNPPGHSGLNAQLIQELDVAKYDIKSTLQFLASSSGESNTVNAYLNDALQRIERVQQSLKTSGGPVPPSLYVDLQIGAIVYKGTEFSQGAKVESLNHMQGRATVRSVVSGNVFPQLIDDLYLTRGCVYNICVGKLVYKGSSYSQGAIVVAVNLKKQKAVIRSKVSGNIFDEDVSELEAAN